METILAALLLAGALLFGVFLWVIFFNAVTPFIAKYFRFGEFFAYICKSIRKLFGKSENHSS